MSEHRDERDERERDGEPRDEQYLWSGEGSPSDALDAIERDARAVAMTRPPRLPGRRRALTMALVAGASAVGLSLLLIPARAVPAHWIARLVPGLSSDVDVTGGAQVAWRARPLPGTRDQSWRAPLSRRLERQGADRVVIDPDGIVLADLPGASADQARRWSESLATRGRLDLRVVAEDRPLMHRIAQRISAGDPRAQAADIRIRHDSWTHQATGRRFQDLYLEGPSRAALESYLDQIAQADPRLAPPPGLTFSFEREDRSGQPALWRSYLLESRSMLGNRDVARATVYADPNTGQPTVLVELTPAGGRAFGDLTARITGRKLAIEVDGIVTSAPVVLDPIRSGRLSISLGTGSDQELWQRGRALVGALTSHEVPVSLEPVSVNLIGPRVGPGARTLMAALLALLMGLMLGGATWLVERRAPGVDPEVSPVRGRARRRWLPWARLAVSAAGGVLAVLATQVPLFGLDRARLDQLGVHLSAFDLGLTPLLTAFLLVELAALAVPPWRRLRTSGPAGRARLGSATAVATVLLALAQTWFITSWLGSLGLVGATGTWLVIASLTGGACVLALAALLLDRYGLGNGVATLLLATSLGAGIKLLVSLAHHPVPADHGMLAIAALIGTALATAWILRRRVGAGSAAVGFRLPTAGIVPLAMVPAALALLAMTWPEAAAWVGWWWQRGLMGGAAAVAIELGAVVLLSAALSWLLSRPSRLGPATSRGDRPARARLQRAFATAVALSTVYLVALWAGGRLLPAGLTVAAVAAATAMVMDLWAEGRALARRDDLTPVWPLCRIQRLDLVIDALTRSGIDVHARGAHLRALLHFFGPFVPVVLMVPAAQVHEARAVIRGQLDLAPPVSDPP